MRLLKRSTHGPENTPFGRERIRNAIYRSFGYNQKAGFITAMKFWDRPSRTDSDWRLTLRKKADSRATVCRLSSHLWLSTECVRPKK